MSLQRNLMAGVAAVSALTVVAPSAAAQSSDLEVEILQLLVDEGVIPFDKAQAILERARQQQQEKAAAEAAENAPDTIDVPYIPQTVREEIENNVRADVIETAKTEGWVAPNVIPDWVNKVKISGDFRARYQREDYPESVLGPNGELIDGNFPYFPDAAEINRLGGVTDADGFPLINSTEDSSRPNYRARIKFEAGIGDNVTVGLRLASGDNDGAVSTNSTFGDYYYKKSIWIDQAYVDVSPLEGVNLIAGRMPNPFFSTNMLWDEDVNPEGLALAADYEINDSVSVFGVGGVFPLQQRDFFDDSYLYAGQIGAKGLFAERLEIEGAVAYYMFDNVQSMKNPDDGSRINDWSAPTYLANGNSLFNIRTDGLTTLAGLAAEYELMAATLRMALRDGDRRYGLIGEVVKNDALDEDEITALRGEPGVEPGDTGWHVKGFAGYPVISERGQWRVEAGYRHVETDAVLDIFTDSDFALGGTDVEGYILKGDVGIYENTSIGAAYLSSDAINRPPFSLDIFQVNLNVHF
ncbi:MAG: putative porin [Hyphomonadaceae bacterium]|nr:putative porin [Hyphomonadaceae bacterium]